LSSLSYISLAQVFSVFGWNDLAIQSAQKAYGLNSNSPGVLYAMGAIYSNDSAGSILGQIKTDPIADEKEEQVEGEAKELAEELGSEIVDEAGSGVAVADAEPETVQAEEVINEEYRILKSNFAEFKPSTGIVTINYFVNNINFSKLNLFGFDFFTTSSTFRKNEFGSYLYKDHNGLYEQKFVHSILNDKVVIFY
jgi:hypothetical protein